MSLTPEQEVKVAEIISAYENGKKISDLEEVVDTTPFNLLVEVMDTTDNASKKFTLSNILQNYEDYYMYGVEFDTEVSSPVLTRIGNMTLHRTLPIQSKMRGCLLNDNGEVVKYLNASDWTSETRDGSQGQVMVEIPAHYVKFEEEGTKRRVKMSELPLPGYHLVDKVYVSAYEAALDHTDSTTPKLASVVNSSINYRGGDYTSPHADWDGTYRSLLGRPITNINRTKSRTYARNRKAGDTRWNMYTYTAHKTLYWLYVVEYANFNSQADYTAELTSEGYRQGGLGMGVTQFNNWDDFNQINPFVPCGHTDSLGNGTGIVNYTVSDGSRTYTSNVPRYRGVENPFGHINKFSDGVNVIGTDNKVYVTNNPTLFKDNSNDGYTFVGNQKTDQEYGKKHIFGEGGEMIASDVGGSSSTYLCDFVSCDAYDFEVVRIVYFGGYAYNGSSAGLASSESSLDFTHYDSRVGSRLCFLP